MNKFVIYLVCLVSSSVLLGVTQNKHARYTEAQAAYTRGYAHYMRAQDEQEKQEGLQLLMHAAQLGHTYAQVFLGNYYYIVIGNRDRAETWYKRAADAHNALACYGYACIARNKRNFGVAADYFRKAALLGCKYAFSELGVLYFIGKGVEAQDYCTAYTLFQRGVTCGDDNARANSILFEKAANQADAFEKLLTTSENTAVKEYCSQQLDKLAYAGDKAACLYQAYNHAHEYLPEHDISKAHKYLRMTECMLKDSISFSRKLTRRTKLYQTLMKLIEFKSSYACWFLSELLSNKDPVRALMYKKQAFEYGSLSDGLALALCYKYSTCDVQEKEEALGYYRKVLIKAHEKSHITLINTHGTELEKLSDTYIEAQAQRILLALWGTCPQLSSVGAIRAYFGVLHKRACTLDRYSLLQRLLQEIEELALQEKHGRCACFLASVYLTPGVYNKPEKGMLYLEQALKHTTKDALEILIELVECKNTTNVNGDRSHDIVYTNSIIAYIRALSIAGVWQAQYIMGIWSLLGYPIDRDSEHAYVLLNKVQEQVPDHAGVWYFIGLVHIYKIHEYNHDIHIMQVHKEQALLCLHKAAESKFEPALFTLGKIYQEGLFYDQQLIITPDAHHAYSYFKQLETLGHPEGTQQLGLLYYHGLGVEKSNKKACEFLCKAYKAGIEDALDGLGLLLGDRENTGPKLTYKQQVTVLNILENVAVQPGHSKYLQACTYLITIYRDGIGVNKDIKKAADYALAVLRQSSIAQQKLKSGAFGKEVELLFDVLIKQSYQGNRSLYGVLSKLKELYFKSDFEQLVKDVQDNCVHIRLKSLVGLVASYMRGRGVQVDFTRAVAYARQILSTPVYINVLQSLLKLEEQQVPVVENTTNTPNICFAKVFLVVLRQLVQSLEALCVVDRDARVLYRLLRTVVHECPLTLGITFKDDV